MIRFPTPPGQRPGYSTMTERICQPSSLQVNRYAVVRCKLGFIAAAKVICGFFIAEDDKGIVNVGRCDGVISSRPVFLNPLWIKEEVELVFCSILVWVNETWFWKTRPAWELSIADRFEKNTGRGIPCSCFCLIIAACCSFVRWNSVPVCYSHGESWVRMI